MILWRFGDQVTSFKMANKIVNIYSVIIISNQNMQFFVRKHRNIFSFLWSFRDTKMMQLQLRFFWGLVYTIQNKSQIHLMTKILHTLTEIALGYLPRYSIWWPVVIISSNDLVPVWQQSLPNQWWKNKKNKNINDLVQDSGTSCVLIVLIMQSCIKSCTCSFGTCP